MSAESQGTAPKGAGGGRNDLTAMSDEALNHRADQLLFANAARMTYREKRKNADAYMRVKAEIDRRAALAKAGGES